MKTSNLLVMLLALGVGVSGGTGIAQSVVDPTEVEAIKALMVQTTETFNRHDAKAWARFCTPDAQLVTVRGESMKGISEIEKGLSTVLKLEHVGRFSRQWTSPLGSSDRTWPWRT